MCFLLPLTSTKRVSKLHGLSLPVRHSLGWKSCTLSYIHDFMAKTQNLTVHDPRFEEFMIPSFDDFVIETTFVSYQGPQEVSPLWSSAILTSVTIFSLQLRRRNMYPETPSHNGLNWSSTTNIHLFHRTANLCRVKVHKIWKTTS